MANVADAPDPSWLPWLSVGGPIVTFLAIIGGGIKWLYEYRKGRVATGLVDAQTDQTIVNATKDLIAVVRSELGVLKATLGERDTTIAQMKADGIVKDADIAKKVLRINRLEAALTAQGIPIPQEPS